MIEIAREGVVQLTDYFHTDDIRRLKINIPARHLSEYFRCRHIIVQLVSPRNRYDVLELIEDLGAGGLGMVDGPILAGPLDGLDDILGRGNTSIEKLAEVELGDLGEHGITWLRGWIGIHAMEKGSLEIDAGDMGDDTESRSRRSVDLRCAPCNTIHFSR